MTGGAGYIGSHACKKLGQMGYNPITFDNLETGWRDAVQFGPFEKGDLLNPEDLNRVFSIWNPKAVMHFAALSEVETSVKKPELYWKNNVIGSFNLLEAMLRANCNKLIFSSTCSIYGENDKVIVQEDTPTNPVNPYAATKKATEDMISDYVVTSGIKVIRFRYFNVAGAAPQGNIGEFHRPETHLIPSVLEKIKSETGCIEIYCDDYGTPDGTCIRDFIHVEDLVDAHFLGLVNILTANRKDEVYNLGNGNGYSVKDIIQCCFSICKKELPVVIKDRRPGDASTIISGSKKANLELGWRCKFPEIEKIVADSWNWIQKGSYNQ